MVSIIKAIDHILEDLSSPNAMVKTYIDNNPNAHKFQSFDHLKPFSPHLLYRKKGLNITKHNQIMKKNGLGKDKPKSKVKSK
jgi:hypothetical protein